MLVLVDVDVMLMRMRMGMLCMRVEMREVVLDVLHDLRVERDVVVVW